MVANRVRISKMPRCREASSTQHHSKEGLTWNMPTQRQLLTFAAAFESLTGLALILAPKATAVFILGAEPNVVGKMLRRVCGVALVALGIACWGARKDSESAARSGTLKTITFYNAGVGLSTSARASFSFQ